MFSKCSPPSNREQHLQALLVSENAGQATSEQNQCGGLPRPGRHDRLREDHQNFKPLGGSAFGKVSTTEARDKTGNYDSTQLATLESQSAPWTKNVSPLRGQRTPTGKAKPGPTKNKCRILRNMPAMPPRMCFTREVRRKPRLNQPSSRWRKNAGHSFMHQYKHQVERPHPYLQTTQAQHKALEQRLFC